MKIEKISDSQIRFTLTREDLEQRQLKLSELAYGTNKARKLFQDMMQQAAYQYGFDATNIPLMIEAIPMSGESIVLLVTKVENPEELDTRFSNFAPSIEEKQDADDAASSNILDKLIDAVRGTSAESDAASDGNAAGTRQGAGTISKGNNGSQNTQSKAFMAAQREEYRKLREYVMTHRLYTFDSMESLIKAARQTAGSFTGTSDLLRDNDSGRYDLFLTMKDIDEVSAMQNVLATISEYGKAELATYAREHHLFEHNQVLVRGNALQQLGQV